MHAGKGRPVFADPTGWRKDIWTALSWAAGALLGSLIVCIVVTSLVAPKVPPSPLTFDSTRKSLAADPESAFVQPSSENSVLLGKPSHRLTRYGFVTKLDLNAFASVTNNARNFDVLVGDWLRLGHDGLQHDDIGVADLVLPHHCHGLGSQHRLAVEAALVEEARNRSAGAARRCRFWRKNGLPI